MLPEPIVENLVPGLDQQDKVRGLGMDLGHWGCFQHPMEEDVHETSSLEELLRDVEDATLLSDPQVKASAPE